jgi:hypothetical protein
LACRAGEPVGPGAAGGGEGGRRRTCRALGRARGEGARRGRRREGGRKIKEREERKEKKKGKRKKREKERKKRKRKEKENKNRKMGKRKRKELGKILEKFRGISREIRKGNEEEFCGFFWVFTDIGVNSGTTVMARLTGRRDRGVCGIPGVVADRGVGTARDGRWPGCRRCRRDSRHACRG